LITVGNKDEVSRAAAAGMGGVFFTKLLASNTDRRAKAQSQIEADST